MGIRDWFNRVTGRKAALDEHSGRGLIPSVMRGATSVAGIPITPDNALTFAAVFACVRVLAEDVSSLPLILYRREERGKSRAINHPLYDVLHDAANEETTSNTLLEAMMTNVLLWGNAFAQIVLNTDGSVRELWHLESRYMTMRRGTDGALLFDYKSPTMTRTFERWEIWHVPGLTLNGVTGLSVLGYWRRAIGLGLTLDSFTEAFWDNGAHPGIVFKYPGVVTPEMRKNIIESWNDRHQGVENIGRTEVLEEGMDFAAVPPMPLDDAQFLDSKKFQAIEVARLFRVPPHKVGILDNATFSNIEHQGLEYVSGSLRPWLVRFEKRAGLHLLLKDERRDYFAEFLLDALLRGDTATRYQAYTSAIYAGWLTRNQVRGIENMNQDDAELDKYLVPQNMAVAGEQPAQMTSAAGAMAPLMDSRQEHSGMTAEPSNGNGRH